MFQYVWIVILGLVWLAFTIRAVIDGIQYFICRKDYLNPFGGWALCWIICHIVFLFSASIIYYTELHS